MHIAILGRQPDLGIAELEALYGNDVRSFSDYSALVDVDRLTVEHLGGTVKVGRVTKKLPKSDWAKTSAAILQFYTKEWAHFDGKLTLGISAYGFSASSREIQKTGILIKQRLKKQGISIRLVPNTEPALNSATSHHNKLGLAKNKVELLVVRNHQGTVIVSESTGAQNISALARRDQARPKRDAFVGMLPPKLAQIIINLALPAKKAKEDIRVLDPFCGTGVILQEAALMGYKVYGTDLSDKMVAYSKENLEWLAASQHISVDAIIEQGDAMTTSWQQPIGAVACEAYLGQPFSAPPSPSKLQEVRRNCNHIASDFLSNIARQIPAGTSLCVALPAWRSTDGTFTHLPLIENLATLGYHQRHFQTVPHGKPLLYYRESQVVARELLCLTRS